MSVALILELVLGTAALLGAIAAIGKLLRIGKLRRGVDDFLHDWNGEPARDGYPGRPSFPARLTNLEKEFKPNGGGSLRDLANKAAVESSEARARALEAAEATAEISGALGRAAYAAQQERAAADGKLDALARSLGEFARDTRERERRYVEALREVADIDLTGVTEDLNDRELEGE